MTSPLRQEALAAYEKATSGFYDPVSVIEEFGIAVHNRAQGGRKMADQELNEAVAKKLGWTDIHPLEHEPSQLVGNRNGKGTLEALPDYCHSIEAAWKIMQWCKVDYHTGSIAEFAVGYDSVAHWTAWIMDYRDSQHKPTHYTASADTAPMSICLAFLKLTEGK